jgi:hypothetical protein
MTTMASLSEKQLQATVVEACKAAGLLCYHTFDSRRSASGFPDLVIVGRGGVLFRELKTAKGRVSVEQQAWLDALVAAGADAAVWRPADLATGAISSRLRALRRRPARTPETHCHVTRADGDEPCLLGAHDDDVHEDPDGTEWLAEPLTRKEGRRG